MVFEELYLSGNFILHIYGDDFDNITNIKKIDLSNNSLILFEPQHELSSLGSLNMDNNSLKEIPNLQGTYNSLGEIRLQNNDISFRSLLMLKEKINGSEQSLNSLFLNGNEDFVNNLYAVIKYLEEFPNLHTSDLSASQLGKRFEITKNSSVMVS